jgi:hypothetical protein
MVIFHSYVNVYQRATNSPNAPSPASPLIVKKIEFLNFEGEMCEIKRTTHNG